MAALGLGLAALGRPEYLTVGHEDAVAGRFDPAELQRLCHAVLDAAWDGGVRHLDAARSYGSAELFLGTWLAAHPGRRSEITVGSKWGYEYVADFRRGADVHEVKEHSPARLAVQWPQTLDALVDPPDHYLVHSVTSDSPALSDDALLERLRELGRAGVRVGISTSGPEQAAVVRVALELDLFTSVQSTWNPLEPSVGPALADAHDAGWFVVVKEAMANGRLVAEDTPLSALAAELHLGRDALALAVALAQPWADVVLSGAATTAQLRQNLQARAVPHSAVELAEEVGTGLREGPESYWGTRADLAWT